MRSDWEWIIIVVTVRREGREGDFSKQKVTHWKMGRRYSIH